MQFVSALNQFAGDAFQGVRRAFKGRLVYFQHIADAVHQQTENALPGLKDDVDRQAAILAILHLQQATQIDRGDNLAAQVDQAAHHRRSQRHRGNDLVTDHFLDFFDVHAEKPVIQKKGAELPQVSHRSGLFNHRQQRFGLAQKTLDVE